MRRTDFTLDVPDIHCDGCVNRIETVLNREEGVRSASVDLDEKRARVTYDADTTTPDALVDAIEQAGYSPTRS